MSTNFTSNFKTTSFFNKIRRFYYFISVTLSLFMSLTMDCFSQDMLNLAMKATVSTSFVSPWERLEAVKDGNEPESSSDKSRGAYGNWNGESEFDSYNWVQYDWEQAHQLSTTEIYWWNDGQGIAQPTDAYIEYWNGSSWIKAGKIGISMNEYNPLNLGIWANKLRVTMKSLKATGILEWKVIGIESDPCDPTILISYVQVNRGGMILKNSALVAEGDTVLFDLAPEDGSWNWSGPDGFTASERQLFLPSLKSSQSGVYTATFMNACGAFSSQVFHLTVSKSEPGEEYFWPEYSPTLNYNFRDEYPNITQPKQDLNDCPEVIGSQSLAWWTFRWGPNANSLVSSAAITPMLERMNKDFAYFRDSMGWPPDKRARNGYRSAIYLYGSGLCTDNASNTDLGGWQSTIFYQGESWPMVLISYYPVYCYDPSCNYNDIEYQTSAVIHEGIHSILAGLPGCRNAAWFHEGGNTWLQQEADSRRSGNYSKMGYLNAASYIAPFMPIECYSGWLQDGSFGGPSAEGVNRYQGNQQLCTWRNLLGGNQYGNTFPVFLGQSLGVGSIPWIWRYCPSRVLEGMADSLGDSQTRRLITEYRAKQTLLDMGKWTGALKQLLDDNFKKTIKAERQPSWLNPEIWIASPYVNTNNNGKGLLTPEYRTTPGWSGANQIPLLIEGDEVLIDFQPIGSNMSCLLCYRTKEGETVYSQPVTGGECRLELKKMPANNVVFAVICNTDYEYLGEETRTAHHDYRLQLLNGVVRPANIYIEWYDWTKDLVDISSSDNKLVKKDYSVTAYPNPSNNKLNLELGEWGEWQISIHDQSGRSILNKQCKGTQCQINTEKLTNGIYYLSIKGSGKVAQTKFIKQ